MRTGSRAAPLDERPTLAAGCPRDRREDRVGAERVRRLARLRTVASRAEVGLGEWLDTLAIGEDVDPTLYELTLTGSRCSLLPVDSVPPVRPPGHFYGSGQEMVDLSAQLCPGAPR